MRQSKSKFPLIFLIFVAACVALSAVFLVYVGYVVGDYDKLQPERAVEAELSRISAAVADGSFAGELSFEKMYNSRYENNDFAAMKREYLDKLSKGTLEYRLLGGSGGENEKAYAVSCGGENVGTLTLKSANPRTRLFFFSSADWSVKGFEPAVSATVYNLKVFEPSGVAVTINGISPIKEELCGGTSVPCYEINGLLAAPEIVYRDADGKELDIISKDNVIKPAVYTYNIKLPDGISAAVNGAPAAVSGGVCVVREMEKPEIVLSDMFGGSQAYDGGEVGCRTFSVTVPRDAVLSVGGNSLDTLCAPQDVTTDWTELADILGTVPLKRYRFASFGEAPKLSYTLGGKTSELAMTTGSIEIIAEGLPASDVPAEFPLSILDVCETWSKFLSNELYGDLHGFYQISPYILEGTAYYDYAYQWARGHEINFNSAHSVLGFSEESIDSVVVYGADCFSCRVHFIKNVLIFDGTPLDEVFNSTVYWVRTDAGWKIATMREYLEEV